MGFGVKVNPSGRIAFIFEVRYQGKSYRKTLGTYPRLALKDAGKEALSFIADVTSGKNLSFR